VEDYPYEVFVGDFAFVYAYELPAELIALFTEADRVRALEDLSDVDDSEESLDEAEERAAAEIEEVDFVSDGTQARYAASISVMRQRLEIMGFVNSLWEQELKAFVDRTIEYGSQRRERYEMGTSEWVRETRRLMILEQSSLKRWMKKLLLVNDRGWNESWSTPGDTLAHELFDRKTGFPEQIFSRTLIFLRGALEAVRDDDEVVFDFSNAVYQDVTAPGTHLSAIGRNRLMQPVREFERILILTEGRTDARVIRESFEAMRPEIAHMYSYMEHEAFKAEGGASALVNLARSMAAAGISNRIVFLFDNDTAGHEGLTNFKKQRIPSHYKAITLPHLKAAESYPTIGPTGEALADINECACGIEIYCGSKALTKEDGQPCSIQWTGYNGGMKRYQGEPLDKDGIKKRFLNSLAASADPATDPEFESMRLVLSTIGGLLWK
jgi:hypothetical protein